MLGFTKLFCNNWPTTASTFAAAVHTSTTETPSKECSFTSTNPPARIPVEALNWMTLENLMVHDLAKGRQPALKAILSAGGSIPKAWMVHNQTEPFVYLSGDSFTIQQLKVMIMITVPKR